MSPVKLFYSYAPEDAALQRHLETHLALLKRQNVILDWHARRVAPGTDWAQESDENLANADIILLLVSADFLASDYCYQEEMRRALERHRMGTAIVIPIIVRPVDWADAPFGDLSVLPSEGRPVVQWTSEDDAWSDVTRQLREVCARFRMRTSPHEATSTTSHQEQRRPNHDITSGNNGGGASKMRGWQLVALGIIVAGALALALWGALGALSVTSTPTAIAPVQVAPLASGPIMSVTANHGSVGSIAVGSGNSVTVTIDTGSPTPGPSDTPASSAGAPRSAAEPGR